MNNIMNSGSTQIDGNLCAKITFTDDEKNNKEEFYWKLLHYKLFGDFHDIPMTQVNNEKIVRTNMDDYFCVNSDDYLLRNEFEFKGESDYCKLWDYLKDNENVILAGGYMTSMLFGIDFFPTSDIDLFVRRDRFMEVISFIRDNFDIVRYEKVCSLVMNIVLNDGRRNIQIIVKDFDKVSNLLDDFDMCHSKCAYYLGNTYHTYDAEYAKDNKVTMSFQNVRVDRAEKAEKYGLKLFNRNMYFREPKGVEEFVNYFDYDMRKSQEFHSRREMNNAIVVADHFHPEFFLNFGCTSGLEDRSSYNFDFYEFTDSVLYEEIDLNCKDFAFDSSDKIMKATRYNYHHYTNIYKMVQFNEYFQVPCILYFTTQADYDKVTPIGFDVHLRGVKNYENIVKNIETIAASLGAAENLSIYSDLDCATDDDNIIQIESAYNDTSGLDKKTSEKLCLIFSKGRKDWTGGMYWNVCFNLFPSSVNY
jgi:hypothetical protein